MIIWLLSLSKSVDEEALARAWKAILYVEQHLLKPAPRGKK